MLWASMEPGQALQKWRKNIIESVSEIGSLLFFSPQQARAAATRDFLVGTRLKGGGETYESVFLGLRVLLTCKWVNFIALPMLIYLHL